MSGKVTGWVLEHGPHPEHLDRDGRPYGARARGLRAVLVTVADAANAEGQNSHPGIENVMSGALYGRRQALDLLAELVAEGWLTVTEQGGGRGRATVYTVPMVSREKVQSLHPDSARNGAVSVPETVQSSRETVQSEGQTVHPGVHPNGVATTQPNVTTQPDAKFAAFWHAYPRKVGKPAAQKAWAKAVKRAHPDVIIVAAIRYANDPNRLDEFTKHPGPWLNDDRWNDGPLPARGSRVGRAMQGRAEVGHLPPGSLDIPTARRSQP